MRGEASKKWRNRNWEDGFLPRHSRCPWSCFLWCHLAAAVSGGSRAVKQAVLSGDYPAKGMTKDQVRARFGSPNLVQRREGGGELWVYSYVSTQNPYGPLFRIPVIGLFFIKYETESYSLTLLFDENGRVVRPASSGETHLDTQ